MLRRRFWLWILLLVLVAALAATVAPREQTSTRPGVSSVVAGPPAPTVRGRMPARRPLTAAVGDVVDLSVSMTEADEAQIEPLAVQAPGEPAMPAQLQFVAASPGRFAVVLRDSGRRVGTLVVRRAG